MSATDPLQFKILFIDDDPKYLDLAGRSFGDLSGGTWNILTASDAASASAVLKEHQVDLLVLDVRIPDVSGLQLIGILQKEYPERVVEGAGETRRSHHASSDDP